MNRLAAERSPYLLQHARNPVDWYPWGDEAFATARADDKPILLSIGYSACHWCHVMERESFENAALAAEMNARFVCIKVDREERPDVDQVYMAAVQAMTGQGGWPLTVFLTPDGRPYFGGTYFPPGDRYGRPGLLRVLLGASEAYRQRRDEIERAARDLLAHLGGAAAATSTEPLTLEALERAVTGLQASFEPRHGGFGHAPKFPQAMALEFLLQRRFALKGAGEATAQLDLILGKTLDEMAAGGLFDHLAGGFHRYSTDDRWLVPHFEKMLYDNALLARVYLLAGQALGEPRYLRVAARTLDWLATDMRDPSGGFYSALDADSEGIEGKYYVWKAADIAELLGDDPHLASRFMAFYHVTQGGNWEGASILCHDPGAAPAADLITARARLLAARGERVPPGRDDKVIAAWNGLVLEAFALAAARGLPSEAGIDYGGVAVDLARFLEGELWCDGTLLRIWKDGSAGILGFLDDHANVAAGWLSLYEATFDERWFSRALEVAELALTRFWDAEAGCFHDTGTQHETLVKRPREVFDNATPAANSQMARLLLKLHHLTGEDRFEAVARQALEAVAELAERYPVGFGRALCAIDVMLADVVAVAIAGPLADPATQALLQAVQSDGSPYRAVAINLADEPSLVPLLQGRSAVEGHPTAYVCRAFACQAPVTRPEDLARLI